MWNKDKKNHEKERGMGSNEDNFLTVTVIVQQYTLAATSDPSAYKPRCFYRWLHLHKENLGRRTANRNFLKREKIKHKTDLFCYIHEGFSHHSLIRQIMYLTKYTTWIILQSTKG